MKCQAHSGVQICFYDGQVWDLKGEFFNASPRKKMSMQVHIDNTYGCLLVTHEGNMMSTWNLVKTGHNLRENTEIYIKSMKVLQFT
jgi:hypothetical protein